MAIRTQYFMRVFLLVGLFETIAFWDTFVRDTKMSNPFTKRLSQALILVSFIALVGIFSAKIYLFFNPKIWMQNNKYPIGALSYLKAQSSNGNIFNNYDWGGYMIWQAPEYKTFIDGRMPSWSINGRYLMDDYIKMSYFPNDNKDLLNQYIQKYSIDTFLLSPKQKLSDYLKTEMSEKWQVAYEDTSSIVFTLR